MDASELKTYEQQLTQVQGALVADSDNEELKNLEVELKNLISLTKQLLGQAESSTPSSSSASTSVVSKKDTPKPATTNAAPRASDVKHFAAGDECQAKYAGDGRWYSARIVSVGGSSTDPKYSVLYKGYDSTEIVTSDSLRPLKGVVGSHGTNITTSGQPADTTTKRSASATSKLTPEETTERERKRKRSEKKAERTANKSAEANALQNNWQKFAKKAEKKGTLKGDKSMFKTPEDPLAKGE
ncbi:hypothetical protein CBS101457_001060 [Exobasidium rhododendri]|nr:hypothetical protein CBS101457_001060 [Exobasidium rhododendri]